MNFYFNFAEYIMLNLLLSQLMFFYFFFKINLTSFGHFNHLLLHSLFISIMIQTFIILQNFHYCYYPLLQQSYCHLDSTKLLTEIIILYFSQIIQYYS